MENGYLIVQIKLTNHTDLDTKPLPTKLKETLKRKNILHQFSGFSFLGNKYTNFAQLRVHK